jgi:hypothetical protein
METHQPKRYAMSLSHEWVGYFGVIAASIVLGLVLTLPMFNLSSLGYLLVRLRQRQKTGLGAQARPPQLLVYVENQGKHAILFLIPLSLNVFIYWFIDPDHWWWGTVLGVEVCAVLLYQQFRARRFLADIAAYFRVTAPEVSCLDGLILDQAVESEQQGVAEYWGRVIKVLAFIGSDTLGQRCQFFVAFPTEQQYRIRTIPAHQPVRIFFYPARRVRDLPRGVTGCVVGVQSIEVGVSGTSVKRQRQPVDCPT